MLSIFEATHRSVTSKTTLSFSYFENVQGPAHDTFLKVSRVSGIHIMGNPSQSHSFACHMRSHSVACPGERAQFQPQPDKPVLN